MSEFKVGELLRAIHLPGGFSSKVGANCDSIIVGMELAQMSMVPWFEVYKDGRLIAKWNAALVEGVEY